MGISRIAVLSRQTLLASVQAHCKENLGHFHLLHAKKHKKQDIWIKPLYKKKLTFIKGLLSDFPDWVLSDFILLKYLNFLPKPMLAYL